MCGVFGCVFAHSGKLSAIHQQPESGGQWDRTGNDLPLKDALLFLSEVVCTTKHGAWEERDKLYFLDESID